MTTYPTDVEQYFQSQVSLGVFPSREAIVIDAVRLHREMQERRARLKADIQIAIDESDRGLGTPLDVEEICRELDEELDDEGRPR